MRWEYLCWDLILTTLEIRFRMRDCCSSASCGAEGPGLASSMWGTSSGAGGTATSTGAGGLTLCRIRDGAAIRRASPLLLGAEAVATEGALGFTLGNLTLRLWVGRAMDEVPGWGAGFGTGSSGAWLPRMIRWPASGGPNLSGAAAISTAGGIRGAEGGWGGWGTWAGGWAGAWARGWGSIWMRFPCMRLSGWGWVIRAGACVLGCWGTTTSFTSLTWMRVAVAPGWACVDVPGWVCIWAWDCANDVLAWGLSCEDVLVLAFSRVFVEELVMAQEDWAALLGVLTCGATVLCAEGPACGCVSPDVLGWGGGWGSPCKGVLDVEAVAFVFVEVEGVWVDENVWRSTDVLSSCCKFVLGFGWGSVCDEEPGCCLMWPLVLGCTGVCMACLMREELASSFLEVEGAEPGFPVGTPEAALLWPTAWTLREAPLHFAAGRITCLRAGVSGYRKTRGAKETN